jgi:hypothetical protein
VLARPSIGKPQIDVVLVFADPLGTIEKLGLLLIHSDFGVIHFAETGPDFARLTRSAGSLVVAITSACLAERIHPNDGLTERASIALESHH